jgi:ribosomal protein L11 methylase PrmA
MKSKKPVEVGSNVDVKPTTGPKPPKKATIAAAALAFGTGADAFGMEDGAGLAGTLCES